MHAARVFAVLALALGLSACATPEPVTRSVGVEALTLASQGGPVPSATAQVRAARYAVQDVHVTVPHALKVSEANTFKPRADIVWRGDPTGDRYAQVGAILTDAARGATADMTAGQGVVIDITLVKFHALTEKTRYTIGGTHDLRFDLTVRDAATGAVIDGPRLIVADVKAAGGAQAIAEDAAGRTQKVVVTERLTQVLQRELSAPVPDLGPVPMLVARAAFQPQATGLLLR